MIYTFRMCEWGTKGKTNYIKEFYNCKVAFSAERNQYEEFISIHSDNVIIPRFKCYFEVKV